MTDTKLSIVITGADTELGQETVRQFVAQGHKVSGLTQDKNGAATVRSHGGIAVETDPSNAVELRDAILAANADVVTPQQVVYRSLNYQLFPASHVRLSAPTQSMKTFYNKCIGSLIYD